MNCEVRRPPPPGEPCPAAALYKVTLHDESTALACQECALYLKQVADEHKTVIKFERLPAGALLPSKFQ